MSTCGAGNTMAGGRRRKSRKTRKARGGAYGFGSPITVGALEVSKVDTAGPVNSSTGAKDVDIYAGGDSASKIVGGRRRKSRKSKKVKKGGKKSRKTRKGRKMRGGVSLENISTAGTSFTGAVPGMPGSQTYGGYTGYSVGSPAGNPHSTGADGVTRV